MIAANAGSRHMSSMVIDRDRGLAAFGALAAGAALGAALLSERVLGLVPCLLCLWERWPYRVAAAVGLLALIAPRAWVRPLLLLLGAALLAGAGLAALHVGVEQGWWPSPLPGCNAALLGEGSIAERLARMPATPSKPCDAPTYLVPGLPLSMAALNLGFALALAGFLAISMAKQQGRT